MSRDIKTESNHIRFGSVFLDESIGNFMYLFTIGPSVTMRKINVGGVHYDILLTADGHLCYTLLYNDDCFL